jgi:hypothetical protein
MRRIPKAHVVLKRTEVIDDTVKLPRPKLTQEIMLIGDKITCMEMLEELSELSINQSTDIIKVDLVCVPYTGQKTVTSTRKDNGKRKPAAKTTR